MTVQTQVRPRGIQVQPRKIRGVKGFVFGLAALAAAGTGIGFGVSAIRSDAPSIVAPVSPENAALQRMQAESYLNPSSSAHLEAVKRYHQDAQSGIDGTSSTEAFKRMKDEAWSK
jgi:hypothetical protein